jgi:hypothetical protein
MNEEIDPFEDDTPIEVDEELACSLANPESCESCT